MQRGLIFLICAALLPFASFSLNSDEDFEVISFSDVPALTSEELDTLKSAVGATSPVSTNINGRFGLINHGNICYMSAFVTAAFNILSFRKALYACEPKNASTVMLAEVFAKLQAGKGSVSTKLCLMPAMRNEINWIFGGMECNMEFGGRFLDILPESVKALYNTSVRTNYFLVEGGGLLKTKSVMESHVIVTPTFASISDAIQTRFHSRFDYEIKNSELGEYEGRIAPFTEDKKAFPVNAEEIIENRPEILIFGIARKLPGVFNNNPMELDFEITLPGLTADSEPVKYVLQSFCYHIPGHYISYARDFTQGSVDGVWYKYNDSTVSAVITETDRMMLRQSANTAATFAFYVRADRVATHLNYSEAQVPERIMRIARLMLALEDILERRNDMEAEERKKLYRSPPAPSVDYNTSPNSINSSSSLLKPSLYRSPVINFLSDDEKKRSVNIPSPTNRRFFDSFPLDAEYFFSQPKDDYTMGHCYFDDRVPEA